MVARAVATNRAFPRPQRARQPTMAEMEPDDPARPAPTMMMTRPMSRVRFAPIRLETTPVISMATPITAM